MWSSGKRLSELKNACEHLLKSEQLGNSGLTFLIGYLFFISDCIKADTQKL